jgi:hypothetical protein
MRIPDSIQRDFVSFWRSAGSPVPMTFPKEFVREIDQKLREAEQKNIRAAMDRISDQLSGLTRSRPHARIASVRLHLDGDGQRVWVYCDVEGTGQILRAEFDLAFVTDAEAFEVVKPIYEVCFLMSRSRAPKSRRKCH